MSQVVSQTVVDINTRPWYRKIKRMSEGVKDKRGDPVMCQNGDNRQATWTGERRPVARIMVTGFGLCDECWEKEKL